MSESYGYPWTRQFGEVDGSAYWTWCRAVADLTPHDIIRGFTKTLERESKFPPNMSEFRGLCLPTWADLGLSDSTTAYREAASKSRNPQAQDWSHSAVYLAGRNTGWFNLRTLPSRQTWPQFETFYSQLAERVRKGEDLSENLPKPLDRPGKVGKKTPRHEAAKRIRELRSSIKQGDGTRNPGTPHTDDERADNER